MSVNTTMDVSSTNSTVSSESTTLAINNTAVTQDTNQMNDTDDKDLSPLTIGLIFGLCIAVVLLAIVIALLFLYTIRHKYTASNPRSGTTTRPSQDRYSAAVGSDVNDATTSETHQQHLRADSSLQAAVNNEARQLYQSVDGIRSSNEMGDYIEATSPDASIMQPSYSHLGEIPRNVGSDYETLFGMNAAGGSGVRDVGLPTNRCRSQHVSSVTTSPAVVNNGAKQVHCELDVINEDVDKGGDSKKMVDDIEPPSRSDRMMHPPYSHLGEIQKNMGSAYETLLNTNERSLEIIPVSPRGIQNGSDVENSCMATEAAVYSVIKPKENKENEFAKDDELKTTVVDPMLGEENGHIKSIQNGKKNDEQTNANLITLQIEANIPPVAGGELPTITSSPVHRTQTYQNVEPSVQTDDSQTIFAGTSKENTSVLSGGPGKVYFSEKIHTNLTPRGIQNGNEVENSCMVSEPAVASVIKPNENAQYETVKEDEPKEAAVDPILDGGKSDVKSTHNVAESDEQKYSNFSPLQTQTELPPTADRDLPTNNLLAHKDHNYQNVEPFVQTAENQTLSSDTRNEISHAFSNDSEEVYCNAKLLTSFTPRGLQNSNEIENSCMANGAAVDFVIKPNENAQSEIAKHDELNATVGDPILGEEKTDMDSTHYGKEIEQKESNFTPLQTDTERQPPADEELATVISSSAHKAHTYQNVELFFQADDNQNLSSGTSNEITPSLSGESEEVYCNAKIHTNLTHRGIQSSNEVENSYMANGATVAGASRPHENEQNEIAKNNKLKANAGDTMLDEEKDDISSSYNGKDIDEQRDSNVVTPSSTQTQLLPIADEELPTANSSSMYKVHTYQNVEPFDQADENQTLSSDTTIKNTRERSDKSENMNCDTETHKTLTSPVKAKTVEITSDKEEQSADKIRNVRETPLQKKRYTNVKLPESAKFEEPIHQATGGKEIEQ